MFFAFHLESLLEFPAFPGNVFYKFKRADGGSWGVIGFERGSTCRLPSTFFNNSGNTMNGLSWDGYQANKEDGGFLKRKYAYDIPSGFLIVTMKAVADGEDPSGFSGAEKENLQRLIDQGFCVTRDDGTVAVNAILFKGEANEQLNAYICALPEYCAQKENMHQHIKKVKEIVARYGNPYLTEDFDYYVAMSIELRPIFARLWKDRGLYIGESAQFCAFYY